MLSNGFILCLYFPGQLDAGAAAGITIAVIMIVCICIVSGIIIARMIFRYLKKKGGNAIINVHVHIPYPHERGPTPGRSFAYKRDTDASNIGQSPNLGPM